MRRAALMLTALLALLTGCNQTSPYQQKDGAWYFEQEPIAVEPGEKLTALNHRFAKSERRAFHRSTPIEGADAASFEALDDHYARDRRRVYWAQTYRDGSEYFLIPKSRVRVLEGALPHSFRLISQGYATDGRTLWHEGVAFPVRDLGTFEPLDDGFARDRVRGYYMQTEVPGSDGATFEALDSHYARDAKSIFHARLETDGGAHPPKAEFRLIRGEGVDSFKVLGDGYASTGTLVLHDGLPIEGADAASFRVLETPTEGADAADARSRYLDGKRIGAA